MMTNATVNIAVKIMLVLSLALAVSSCGRRGNLEAPPSSSVVVFDEANQEEQPVEEEKVDKPFILDPLL